MITNGDKIRTMTNEELADYIKSVFVAGCICNQEEPTVNYSEWLNEIYNKLDEPRFNVEHSKLHRWTRPTKKL